jgi:hypothetical protein
MLNLIKDNQEKIVLAAVIVALFVMVAAIGINVRGGQPWGF